MNPFTFNSQTAKPFFFSMKMLSSKNGGFFLPSDITNEMFMNYCDYQTLCNTRELQSPRVRRCTQFGNMKKAIKAGNLENVKWIACQNNVLKKKGDVCLSYAAEVGQLDCLEWLFQALERSFEDEILLGWTIGNMYLAHGKWMPIVF